MLSAFESHSKHLKGKSFHRNQSHNAAHMYDDHSKPRICYTWYVSLSGHPLLFMAVSVIGF